jgi:hypothetical protein
MDPIKISLGSLIASGLAVIVSILTFIWTVRRDRKDRARIEASVKLEILAPDGSGGVLTLKREEWATADYSKSTIRLVVEAANIGRRPVKIVSLYGKEGGLWFWRKALVSDSNSSKTLNEVEQGRLYVSLTPLVFRIRRLYIRDSANKNWAVDQKSFRQSLIEAELFEKEAKRAGD